MIETYRLAKKDITNAFYQLRRQVILNQNLNFIFVRTVTCGSFVQKKLKIIVNFLVDIT